MALTCLLDPRFKKLAFGTDSNAANAQQRFLDELTYLINSTLGTSELVITQPQQLEQVTTSNETIDLGSF